MFDRRPRAEFWCIFQRPAGGNEVPGSVPGGSRRNWFELKNLRLARGCGLTRIVAGIGVQNRPE
jgi:hypothetical protein